MRWFAIFVFGMFVGFLAASRRSAGHEAASHGTPLKVRLADGLTDRQREILALVATGLTTKEIAGRTGISEASVRTHIRRARDRLGAPNRAAAIAAVLATSSLAPSTVKLEANGRLGR